MSGVRNRARYGGRALLVAFVVGSILTGCKRSKDASTGSCSGQSETLSVMPESPSRAELEKASLVSKTASDVLENLSGVGVHLTYVSQRPVNASDLMADSDQEETEGLGPFKTQLPVCTAQLFGIPRVKHRYLIWTSRNCIRWSELKASGGLYMSLFNGRSPLRLHVPRSESWPSGILAQIDQASAESTTASEKLFGALPRAELSNLERFVVSLEHYYESPDSEVKRGEKVLLNMLEQRANQVFSWRADRIQDWRLNNPARLEMIQKWTLLTEKYVLADAMGHWRKAGLVCETVSSSSMCNTITSTLLEEHKIAMAQVGLEGQALTFFNQIVSGASNSISSNGSWKAEREQMFFQIFAALQAQAGSGLVNASLDAGSPQWLKGLAGPRYEQAFLHGFHRERGVSISSYMPMPFADLFSSQEQRFADSVGAPVQSRSYASLAPHGPSGDFRSGTSAKAIVFTGAIQMEAFDEGQMVSLFSFVPVAFVSLPGARFGRVPARFLQKSRAASREGSIHRARCK